MVNKIQLLRSATYGNRPAVGAQPYGAPYVNLADKQFGVVDSTQTPQDLIGVPYFSAAANYNVGNPVNYQGALYYANVTMTAGAWNAANWTNASTALNNKVNRAGDTMTGNLEITAANAQVVLNKTASGQATSIVGQLNGNMRWYLQLGNTNAETGSNVGSDFGIYNYNDAGTYLGNPLSISRANGNVQINALGTGSANLFLNKNGSAQFNTIGGLNNNSPRWYLELGDSTTETGSNVGSNLVIQRFSDAGAGLDVPFTITRSTGNVTLSNGVLCSDGNHTYSFISSCVLGVDFLGGGGVTGINMRQRSAGTNYPMSLWNSATSFIGGISTTDTGTSFNTSSDERLKEDIRTFDAGHIIDNTDVYDFAWKSTKERAYGMSAQQAKDIYPAAVVHNEEKDWWGIDYSKYVPILLQELKMLRARVTELEALIPKAST